MPKGEVPPFVLMLVLVIVIGGWGAEQEHEHEHEQERMEVPPRTPGGACIDTIVKGINISLH